MLKFYDLSDRNYFNKKEWTDNGNGNFASVYFRIDTIGFDCVNGNFANENDRQAFHDEATEIIKSFGIVENCGFRQNNEYLYAHPQNISGIVEKSKIKNIAEVINNSKTMKIRWVDVYEEYALISDDKYMEILNSKRQAIAKYIVNACFTKRTNIFCSRYGMAIEAQERFKVNRINAIEDINNPKMTFKYVQSVIDQLITNGYLIQGTENEIAYIRSLNKTEQRKNKVNYDTMQIGS